MEDSLKRNPCSMRNDEEICIPCNGPCYTTGCGVCKALHKAFNMGQSATFNMQNNFCTDTEQPDILKNLGTRVTFVGK